MKSNNIRGWSTWDRLDIEKIVKVDQSTSLKNFLDKRILNLVRSLILSQWRFFKIGGGTWEKFGVPVTARAVALRMSWRWLNWEVGNLRQTSVATVKSKINKEVAIVTEMCDRDSFEFVLDQENEKKEIYKEQRK
jgi:hypothetical protein